MHIIYPGNEKKARETIKISTAAVDIFNDRFGEYPYTELDLIEDPLGGLIGVEFPNSVLINPSYFSDPIGISHELAHQWWYGVVGNDVIADPWLDEALATYSSVIYFEEAESKQAAQNVLQYYEQEYQKIVNAGADGSRFWRYGIFRRQGCRAIYRDSVFQGCSFFRCTEKGYRR